MFLPDAPVLQRGLPAAVYREMTQKFDALYPPAVRCKPGSTGCWQDQGRPDKVYAFSAFSVWHKTEASRSATVLDFSDPVWQRRRYPKLSERLARHPLPRRLASGLARLQKSAA